MRHNQYSTNPIFNTRQIQVSADQRSHEIDRRHRPRLRPAHILRMRSANAVDLPMGGWLARSRPQRDDRAVVEVRAMEVMAIAKFERFFRLAVSFDVDKSDLKRYGDFVNDKIYD